jgi:hypothetical protein
MIESRLETDFIERFVRKERRQRLLEFAAKVDNRGRLLSKLNSPGIFDPRFVTAIGGSQRVSGVLAGVYKHHGMGGRVYVISENAEWDGQKFQMSYIVDQCLAGCVDTVGYCWKSKIAFFEWHHSGESYLLKRS